MISVVALLAVWVAAQQGCTAESVVYGAQSSIVDPLVGRSPLEKNFIRFGRSWEEMGPEDDGDERLARTGRADGDPRGQSNFIRFGRAKDNFIRFGRGKDNFMRFGRTADVESRDNGDWWGRPIAVSEKSDGTGRAKDNFLRFGRGKDGFMRFGRTEDFQGAVEEASIPSGGDWAENLDRSARDVKALVRAGRHRHTSEKGDGFIRFGRTNF